MQLGIGAVRGFFCSNCDFDKNVKTLEGIKNLPEYFKNKGTLDELHVMQGHGFDVMRQNSAASTTLGVGVGFGIGAPLVKASPIIKSKYVDILSPQEKQHILHGYKPGSGGHLWPGQPGKTAFPKNWSADKIIHEIGDIVTSPNTQWYAQSGNGGKYTNGGKPANWVSYEIRDGVRIRLVYQPATGKVINAFPDNNPMPSYRPVR